MLKVFAIIVSVTLPSYSVFSSAITSENIISLTNETRSNLGLPELGMDERLMQAANAKAQDMFTNQYFAHTSPDGVTPWYWFQTYGYDYRSAGENLAAHFTQAEDVNAAWMASPAHRDNIVSDRYNEIGVGVAQGTFEGYSTTFVVQMFGFEQPPTTVDTPAAAASLTTAESQPVIATEPSVAGMETTEPESAPAVVSTPENVITPQSSLVRQETDNAAIIDMSSLVLTPTKNGYNISISMEHITQAALNFGATHTPLTYNQTSHTWIGAIAYEPINASKEGNQLYMVVTGEDNQQQIVELATLMPSNTPEVFTTLTPETTPKLFGVINLRNMDDSIHVFYIFIMSFVAAALLIAIFIKIEIQKPHMVAHSLFVIALGLFLLII